MSPQLHEQLDGDDGDRQRLASLHAMMEHTKVDLWVADIGIMMAAALVLSFLIGGIYLFIVYHATVENSWLMIGTYMFDLSAMLGGFLYAYYKRVSNKRRLAAIEEEYRRFREKMPRGIAILKQSVLQDLSTFRESEP